MKFHVAVPLGRRPVVKLMRDGEHTEICTYARSKTKPARMASRTSRHPGSREPGTNARSFRK
eukprot:SAG31_NODE_2826_length_5035_cov_2.062601_4_plen_62_part_00